jgi:hypothetical protein
MPGSCAIRSISCHTIDYRATYVEIVPKDMEARDYNRDKLK